MVFISNERIGEIASGDKMMGAPDLAIEIISPGAENERRDRIVKLQTYNKFGVKNTGSLTVSGARLKFTAAPTARSN
jgi:Uma2 family endonuclease